MHKRVLVPYELKRCPISVQHRPEVCASTYALRDSRHILAFGIAVWQTLALRDVVATFYYAAFVQNIWMTRHHGLDNYLNVT